MRFTSLFVGAMLLTGLTACGTTKVVQPVESAAGGVSLPTSLAGYSAVIVQDFTNEVDTTKIKSEDLGAFKEKVNTASRTVADRIATEVRSTGAFSEVSRSSTPGKAVVVTGRITRYAEGNAAARLLVGFGAGSSYFDATITLRDQETGAELGQVIADRNSWALGGGLAAGQTVERHMQGAAKRVAEYLRDEKLGKATTKKK